MTTTRLAAALQQLDAAIARRQSSSRLAKSGSDPVLVQLLAARRKVLAAAIASHDAATLAKAAPRDLEVVGTSAALAGIREARRGA